MLSSTLSLQIPLYSCKISTVITVNILAAVVALHLKTASFVGPIFDVWLAEKSTVLGHSNSSINGP